jgi:hypothetical protein
VLPAGQNFGGGTPILQLQAPRGGPYNKTSTTTIARHTTHKTARLQQQHLQHQKTAKFPAAEKHNKQPHTLSYDSLHIVGNNNHNHNTKVPPTKPKTTKQHTTPTQWRWGEWSIGVFCCLVYGFVGAVWVCGIGFFGGEVFLWVFWGGSFFMGFLGGFFGFFGYSVFECMFFFHAFMSFDRKFYKLF